MIGGTLTDLEMSEVIVIQKIIRTHGQFLDEVQLTADDFSSTLAAWTYETVCAMVRAGTPIDHMTVGLADKRVETYVWTHSDVEDFSAEYHAVLVHESGVRRRLVTIGEAIPDMARSGSNLAEVIDTVRKHVDEAAGLQRQQTAFVGDMLSEVLASIGQPRCAYETPWDHVTENLGGGFRPGALYVLAARPGIGKSALALQMATWLARHGYVSFSSLEMPREELVRRLISQGSGVAHQLLERGTPLPEFAQAKVNFWKERAPVTIAIDDRSSVGVSDIRAHARTLSRNGKLSGIVVDYLQLITGHDGAGRVEQVTEITRQLKILARDMECPVIALSQLNRKSEDRADRRPMISDLRESGSIEQDADCVMLMYRDPSEMPGEFETTTVALEMNIAKNRHGPTGLHTLSWDGAFMRAD